MKLFFDTSFFPHHKRPSITIQRTFIVMLSHIELRRFSALIDFDNGPFCVLGQRFPTRKKQPCHTVHADIPLFDLAGSRSQGGPLPGRRFVRERELLRVTPIYIFLTFRALPFTPT